MAEIVLKQHPSNCLTGDPSMTSCSLREGGLWGLGSLECWSQKSLLSPIYHRHKLCSTSLRLYLQRELRTRWENLPWTLITACVASFKWLFVNE